MGFGRFDQMGSTKITKNRNMVVSRCDTGGFTIAQQLEVDEGGKKTKVFMKGAIFVDSIENFANVVKMLEDVLRKSEEIENTQWDDLSEDDDPEVDLSMGDTDDEDWK